MRAIGIIGVILLIAAVPLLRQYQDSPVFPILGAACFVIGAVLARWSRVNRRK